VKLAVSNDELNFYSTPRCSTVLAVKKLVPVLLDNAMHLLTRMLHLIVLWCLSLQQDGF